ncbi:MAG: mechanosensitive ion channel [Clostridiales bacterium]|nr:mechanosensitive ion channel [Clostridiales bacterium]MBR4010297.1 mechanosensitive ion channel [Clostridiales bacterium]
MNRLNTKKTAVKLLIMLIIMGVLVAIGRAKGIFSSVEGVVSDFHINFSSILKVVIMASLVLAIENLILFILSLCTPKKGRSQTLMSVASNAIRYITAIVVLCWGLTILGANVGTIVAGVGILALIVGFGANTLIADLVTGIFMIFENQYNVGDFIEVAGFRGRVTSIGVRTTCITDMGGNVKIINNSDMSNILNRSSHTSKAVSTIGIPYDADLEALESKIPALLKEIFDKHGTVLKSEPQYLGVDELSDSSVVLKFIVEVDDANIYEATRILNRELLLNFKKYGVEVPFPQIDVHQK